ncbi:MAG TPA: Do family serine endopeptidase [Opitutaceae bacterium]|nr:Do family serine endopeptidase [Opitutaceae bacterium]
MSSSLRIWLCVAVLVFSLPCLGVERAPSSVAPEAKPKPQPKLRLDSSPVNDGKGPGLVTYADVIAPVQKAVASVYSTKTIHQRSPINPLFPFFEAPQRDIKEEGLGSGVIVSEDGYMLTNNHVVEGADELNVQLADSREFKAKVIGTDPKTDVAIIKIEATGLPTVVLADSDKLRVGDIVFAVGNPLGVGQTVTMGIVSATSREVGILEEVAGYENFIQTDAAINQGNSGGALIDAKGRLVGINSAILSTSRGNIGIGFAVPVNLAASIMHSLIETGRVSRGFLGVEVDALSSEVAEALGLKKDTRGVIVNDLTAGGPAEKAGLQRGDVISAINDKPVASRQELRLIVAQLPPNSKATLRYFRDGKEKTLKVKLGTLGDVASDELLPGVHVARLTEDVRRSLNLDTRVDDGLVITTVDPSSPYADRLAPNMVIIEINRAPVSEVESARQLLGRGRNLFLVIARGAPRYVPIPVK